MKIRKFKFYLSNGDLFLTLSYAREQIKENFPGAKIKGSSVYL